MNADEHVERYRDFIEANGNSPNVCAMYFKRVRTFLGKRPEAMLAGEAELRRIVDDYIDSTPVTSGLGVTATAIRYYWTMRFGRPYFKRFDPRNYPEDPGIEAECREFETHLRSTGRLSEATIRGRASKVRQFLYIMFPGGTFSREKVELACVMRYLSEGIAHASASTKRGFCTEVRAYARFLCASGFEATAGPIVKVALKGPLPNDPLPRLISEGDLLAIVESVDSETSRGKRDLAMLLLMGALGLRRSDVALLKLDDVDWANGFVHVRDSKSLSDRSLPLDAETGAALEDYVLNARSRDGGSRSLFLPDGNEEGDTSMAFSQVGRAMSLLSEKAGVKFPGTHSMRRAVATNMLNNGIGIKPIADILGHEDIGTTMGYLRVDLARLRKAASPWPKEVSR